MSHTIHRTVLVLAALTFLYTLAAFVKELSCCGRDPGGAKRTRRFGSASTADSYESTGGSTDSSSGAAPESTVVAIKRKLTKNQIQARSSSSSEEREGSGSSACTKRSDVPHFPLHQPPRVGHGRSLLPTSSHLVSSPFLPSFRTGSDPTLHHVRPRNPIRVGNLLPEHLLRWLVVAVAVWQMQ